MGNVFIFGIYTFITCAVCITLPISNGLVTPSFAIGAAIGRVLGEILVTMPGCEEILPGGYAVVGAAAFAAAVTGKISISVIIFEITSDLSFSIPVLLSVVVARTVSNAITPPIYDRIAKLQNLPHWPAITRTESYFLVARDLMVSVAAYEAVCPSVDLHDVLGLLTRSAVSERKLDMEDQVLRSRARHTVGEINRSDGCYV